MTLVEGLVAVVDLDERRGAASLAVPWGDPSQSLRPGRTVLHAGEQLIAGPDAPPVGVAVDLAEVVGWRDGRLVFRDDPLRDVVKEINGYSTGSTRKLVVDRIAFVWAGET